jgi:3-oxosteroid 1-dehydrogenase
MSSFDENYDWVVVGSGAGSFVSALVMRKAGKSVLILEKTALVGGTTAKSGGVIWVPANRFMLEAGDKDSIEAGIEYLDSVCEDLPGSSHEKRLIYVSEAPKMVDFLLNEGVALERTTDFWPDYYDEAPGGCKTTRTITASYFDKKELGEEWAARLRPGFAHAPARLAEGMQLPFAAKSWKIKLLMARIGLRIIWGKLTGRDWVSAGAALQGRMLMAALKAGVDVRTDTPVKELIVDGGRVVGVVTDKGRIGAHLGVLVNAGGFGRNQAMRDRYMPGTQAAWSNTPEGDTGDLHGEMERIGGVLGQMDQMVGYQMTRMPGWEQAFVKPPIQSTTGKPHAIIVDQSGVRYMNEGGSYELFCQTMRERDKTVPAVPSWAIFDSLFAGQYAIGGVKMAKYYQIWRNSGYLKQADSVEGLALEIGCDPRTLRATVDRWNGFVDAGKDADFGRGDRAYDQWLGDPFRSRKPSPERSLGRIDKGPYYAVDVVPGDVSTYGGAVTDANARVMRGDGSAIAGLYACGTSSASVMGGVYPGAGASIGPSMTFGYLAARHAAGVNQP